jgi:hypothetical protein
MPDGAIHLKNIYYIKIIHISKDSILKKAIMKKLLILLILTMSINSCVSAYGVSSADRKKKYNRMLDSWKGVDINVLINSWGQPTREYKMPNGNIMYTFNEYSGHYNCNTSFTTNEKYKIINWRWDGNACQTTWKPSE